MAGAPLSLWILVANAASVWFLVGLIWVIQVVHYPLFSAVGRESFAAYEAAHTRLITLVVGPVMLVELATSVLLVAVRPAAVPMWAAAVGTALVAIVWLSTIALQVPAHGRLVQGFSAEAHAMLVHSNWIRTAAWTAHGLLCGWMVHMALVSR
jgi:hypothetical protein